MNGLTPRDDLITAADLSGHQRNSAEPVVEILAIRVIREGQAHFPCARPVLHLHLALRLRNCCRRVSLGWSEHPPCARLRYQPVTEM